MTGGGVIPRCGCRGYCGRHVGVVASVRRVGVVLAEAGAAAATAGAAGVVPLGLAALEAGQSGHHLELRLVLARAGHAPSAGRFDWSVLDLVF